MTKFSSWVVFFLFSVFLSACGGSKNSEEKSVATILGLSQKGSFVAGSNVSIFLLDPTNGARTSDVVTAKTLDDQGNYAVDIPWYGWVEVEITGKYFNEVTAVTSDVDKTLSAIGLSEVDSTLSLNVNVFTDIATDRIRNKTAEGISLTQADIEARDEVQEQFNLESNLLTELDISDGSGDHRNDNATLLVFSGAIINSGVTDDEWDKFTSENDEDVYNKIGNAIAPDFLDTLENNLKKFIANSDSEDLSAPDLTDDTLDASWVNKFPTVEVGDDFTVNEQVTVFLTDNQSASDADGSIDSYSWVQSGGEISVDLVNADSNEASFVAPTRLLQDGSISLAFTLTVTDDRGGIATDTVNVTVNPVNATPVAKAGDDQTVNEQQPVNLSAAASSDSDGSIVAYSWKQVGDSSKVVELKGATSKTASFTSPIQLLPDGNHTLTFELTVTDNEEVSHTDTVIVKVNPVNTIPVAKAGDDQTVKEQQPVNLSAAASSDSDGSIVAYSWKQIGDLSKKVELRGATSKTASLTSPVQLLPDENHTLTFELTVTDNEKTTHTDTVTVTVEPVNASPVASAGADQVTKEKLVVTLDASGSMDSDPPSGTTPAASIKSYQWEQINSGTESTPKLLNADTAVATFTAPTLLLSEGEEKLTFKITATDHEGVSATDTVIVRVTAENSHPVADAGASQNVFENTEVTLNASGSKDEDGEIVTYKWTLTNSTVNGIGAILNDESSIAPVFTAPARLETDDLVVLTFNLTVTDNEGYTHEDTTTVTIGPFNATPIANAGENRGVDEQSVVSLNGSASEDPDGTIESYSWRQTGGGTVELSATDKAEVTFTSPTRLATEGSEILTFELTVVDNENKKHTDTIDITVNPVNILPIVKVGPDQTVNEEDIVHLTSSESSDEDSDEELKHEWKQVSGTTVTLTGENTSTPSFKAPPVLALNGQTVSETLLFEVTVTDNEEGSNASIEASSDHLVAITVTSVNVPPIADSGKAAEVDSESIVVLDGSDSTDADGNIVSYFWEQQTGSLVTLSASDTAATRFTVPRIVGSSVEFSFELTVTDNEGYSHTDTVIITANPASVGHAYLKGPLIDGEATFIPYSDMENIAYTTTSTDNPEELSLAGKISVTEGDDGLEDDELYIIKVSMGNDIDHDQDSEKDSSPTSVAGVMHSLMTGADLKKDYWTVTPLTEIAYQQASSLLLSSASVEAIQEQLDNTARQLLADDLTADTVINREDLYAYVPVQNKSSLKLSDTILAEVITNIIAGESTTMASLEASKQIITTRSLLGGSAKSAAINGNYAYVASGGFGLRVVNISNSSDLSVDGIFSTGGSAQDIEIVGNYAYIADNTGLAVINISNPEEPISQKTISLSGTVQGLYIDGDFAYVATGNGGLSTFDISSPANPSYLGNFATTSPAKDVFVVGNRAYVAIGTGGLQVIDTTSKSSMSSVYIEDTAGTANDLLVDGGFVYIADGEKGLQIIDLNQTPIVPVASLSLPGVATGIKKSDDYLYLASGTAGIHLVDVSDPTNPVTLNTVTTSAANDLTLHNDIAYVSDGAAGLTLIDVSNLSSQPHVIATIRTMGNHVDSVATLSDLAVTGISSGDTGFESFDTTSKTAPVLNLSTLLSKSVVDVDTDGAYVYAAVGEDGIKIIKLDEDNITISTFNTTGVANAVKVSGDYLYVADGSAGLKIINTADKTTPVLSGSIDTSGEAIDVTLSSNGNYAYVADSLGGVQVVIVNNKNSPTISNTVEVDSGVANGVYLSSDDTLYVSTSTQGGNGTQGVRIYDVSNEDTLTFLSVFETPNLAHSTVAKGNYAYISNESSGIQVIDVSDKTVPTWAANIDTSGLAHDLSIADDYIYIADQHGGLSIIKSFVTGVSLP